MNFEYNASSEKCIYVACPKGQIYNPSTYTCSCPSGFYFNYQKTACLSCPIGY